MVQYRRAFNDNPDTVYFLTVVTKNRNPIFQKREDFVNLWKSLYDKTQLTHGDLMAFVFLPDHLHILLKQGTKPFSTTISGFKRKMNSFYLESAGSLWQDRFWEHLIRDELDLIRHADYIHYNPVKHGYVKKPVEWKYSSFQKYLKEGIYPHDWAVSDHVKGMDRE